MSRLDASITGITNTNLISVNVNESHASATSIAQIVCRAHSLDIGDHIDINLGYVGSTQRVFRGFVKIIERKTPDSSYSITAYDDMTRAIDFFIVSTNPDSPFSRSNIAAEDLVADVLALAGLNSIDAGTTYFTLAIGVPAEVNLVSSYDYANSIADYVAWKLWCDRDGIIHFKNRKPYPMHGTSGQPGDVADSPIATIDTNYALSYSLTVSEKNLRNKIVVYGSEGIYAEAHRATSYDPLTDSFRQILPTGYYKTTVFASPLMTTVGVCQDACDYNLALYNRLTDELNLSIIGNPALTARETITITDNLGSGALTGDWYIYQLEHNWSKSGYITNLGLRL